MTESDADAVVPMPYGCVRRALFLLEAERAHKTTIRVLRRTPAAWLRYASGRAVPSAPVQLMGLRFANPVGLAAGFDKNGECIDGLAALGFGFIEVGTVTPRAQAGNPRPRVFRLARQQAVINRLGFNNKGVDYLAARLRRMRYRGVLGVNIGKNADTPLESALNDYLICLRKVYSYASYVTVNISSPNTQGLRNLQQGPALCKLLAGLNAERERLGDRHGRRMPLAIKIAPDLSDDEIASVADALVSHGMDAVIATNTTVSRDGLEAESLAREQGGLSGAPLMDRATRVTQRLSRALGDVVPIIGVGGILSGRDARRKREAGARLVQLYSGLIYRGPALIGECVRDLAAS